MANVNLNTNDGTEVFKTTGSGTGGDPHVSHSIIDNTVDVQGTVDIGAIPEVTLNSASQVTAADGGPGFTPLSARLSSADATIAQELVAAPGAGNRIVVYDLFVSVDTNMKVTFRDADPAVRIAGFFTASNGIEPIIPRSTLRCPENKNLEVITSAVGNIEITVYYSIEAV